MLFRSVSFGFPKLTPLVKSLSEHFEVDEREVEHTHIKHIYIKIKKKRPVSKSGRVEKGEKK